MQALTWEAIVAGKPLFWLWIVFDPFINNHKKSTCIIMDIIKITKLFNQINKLIKKK